MKPIMFVFLVSSALWAQANNGQTALPAPQTQSATMAGDGTAQMRSDLDKMESLLSNMSSEIEFLHDQNLQILLRTNARMWTILIRDMRQQLDREERRGLPPAPPKSQPH